MNYVAQFDLGTVLPKNFYESKQFKLLRSNLENSKQSYFLTGNAGTGTSTFVEYFRLNTKKYDEIKRNGDESDIDQFVVERTNDGIMLAININDNIKKEIENEKLKHLGLVDILTKIQNDEDDIMIEEMIKDELERDPFEFVDEEE